MTSKRKSKLYCGFVDYSKAFDTIPRVHLWAKLLSQNINGKVLDVIRNMYSAAKSFIRSNNVTGDLFECNIGVRQGENLSPLLFALYLNDLQEFLSKAYDGLKVVSKMIEVNNQTEDTVLYIKLFAILYADDTIILAESQHEMQAALNGLNHYCKIWKLKINVLKTKVVIFANRQPKQLPVFHLGDLVVEVTSGYTYLGVYMKYNGNMLPGIIRLKQQANRAMYSLLQRSRKLGLGIDIIMQLFDSLVVPICVYGCEVWGFKHAEVMEGLHLQFCKIILKVNKSTPNCMVLGELGRLKLKYNIDVRMLTFWFRIACGRQTKLSHIMYKLLFNLSENGIHNAQWLITIKEMLRKYDLYDVWQSQNTMLLDALGQFKKKCKLKKNCLENSSKCYLYKGFKPELKLEEYLCKLPNDLRINLTKFRLCNHKLPIEIGRHTNIDRNYRICTLCDKHDLGDEYHYMFICKRFSEERSKFIPKCCFQKLSVAKFCELLATNSKNMLFKVAKFARIIMLQVDSS